jgi:gamma-glutamylcyclotransferase (GGCT)/AIG2-like uncharacterized protein YtfP
MLLFVYGSLRKDLWNHFFLKTSQYIGKYKTVEKHILYIDGNIPYLSTKEKRYHIKGELYDVSEETLKEIDLLEDEGKWYTRKKILVINEEGNIIEAQSYYNDNIKNEKLLDTDDYNELYSLYKFL